MCHICFSHWTLRDKDTKFKENPQGLMVTAFYIFLAKNLDLKIQVFWDVAPCRLVTSFRFEGALFLHIQGQAVQKNDPEGEGTTVIRNVGSCLPVDTE
jgi:hypothetical protein